MTRTAHDVYGHRREADVMEGTWGHLRPAPGSHHGQMLVAVSEYGGERLLVAATFPDVPDSPWFYEAAYELIYGAELKEGAAYRFNGVVYADRDNITFQGTWEQVDTGVRAGA